MPKMEENNMSWNDYVPDQRIDPPEMKEADEKALEYAEELLEEIEAIEDKVETFFEELTAPQIAKLLFRAEDILEDLKDLADERTVAEDEYRTGQVVVETIESYLKEKEETGEQ
jgi:hypothetical protein